jgi:RNA polymerase sigma factor (sigma-70 family)
MEEPSRGSSEDPSGRPVTIDEPAGNRGMMGPGAVDASVMDDSVGDRETDLGSEWFSILFENHVRDILAYFQRRLADPALAADLAAETFATAFAHRGRYREASPALPWLYGIAKNELRHAARRGAARSRSRRRLGIERMEVDDVSIERIEELVDFEPTRRVVRSAVSGLREETAKAVWLRIGEQRSYEDVAQILGCSVGAARVRVSRGLQKLAKTLEGVV